MQSYYIFILDLSLLQHSHNLLAVTMTPVIICVFILIINRIVVFGNLMIPFLLFIIFCLNYNQ